MTIKVDLTTSDASGGTQNSLTCPMDWRTNPFQVGITCVVVGTVAYTIQHSNDATNWFPNANINGATVSADTNYMFPVQYIRLQQVSGTGSVIAQVRQSGPNK